MKYVDFYTYRWSLKVAFIHLSLYDSLTILSLIIRTYTLRSIMKKYLLIVLMLAFACCHAEEDEMTWEDYWVSGVYSCSQKEYADGMMYFSEAINRLEASNDKNFPQIYIDRGKLFLMQSDYNSAFKDFELAMQSDRLTTQDKIRISVNRLTAYSELEKHSEVVAELDYLKSIDPNYPKIEFTEHYIFIRNVPANKWYRKAIQCLLIHSGMCSCKGDMYIYPSNILVAVRKCHCGCEACIERDTKLEGCDQCGQALLFNSSGNLPSTEDIENYNQSIDELTIVSTLWCVQMLKKTQSKLAGIYAVDLIRQLAEQNPPNETFYDQCITPFTELLNHPEALGESVWD